MIISIGQRCKFRYHTSRSLLLEGSSQSSRSPGDRIDDTVERERWTKMQSKKRIPRTLPAEYVDLHTFSFERGLKAVANLLVCRCCLGLFTDYIVFGKHEVRFISFRLVIPDNQ